MSGAALVAAWKDPKFRRQYRRRLKLPDFSTIVSRAIEKNRDRMAQNITQNNSLYEELQRRFDALPRPKPPWWYRALSWLTKKKAPEMGALSFNWSLDRSKLTRCRTAGASTYGVHKWRRRWPRPEA